MDPEIHVDPSEKWEVRRPQAVRPPITLSMRKAAHDGILKSLFAKLGERLQTCRPETAERVNDNLIKFFPNHNVRDLPPGSRKLLAFYMQLEVSAMAGDCSLGIDEQGASFWGIKSVFIPSNRLNSFNAGCCPTTLTSRWERYGLRAAFTQSDGVLLMFAKEPPCPAATQIACRLVNDFVSSPNSAFCQVIPSRHSEF